MIDSNQTASFSMRGLAARLNVDPMAIYHHHANKGALIHAVLEAMLEQFKTPEPSGDWRQDVRAICNTFRALAHKHPGAFQVYELYDDWLTGEHRVHEAFHATLRTAGFSAKKTVQAARLLLAYTEVFAIDEVAGWKNPEDRREMKEMLARDGSYPVTLDLIDEILEQDTNADFIYGLDVLLLGLETERKGGLQPS